uniref:Uncharacterized protein n=1 Tax=Physcomitrium patens TaxID=3218 RepID=A0A2K1J9V2_PHYPA|nr:hypothetical protein PHYPA_021419 [Physcomitrium patens]
MLQSLFGNPIVVNQHRKLGQGVVYVCLRFGVNSSLRHDIKHHGWHNQCNRFYDCMASWSLCSRIIFIFLKNKVVDPFAD